MKDKRAPEIHHLKEGEAMVGSKTEAVPSGPTVSLEKIADYLMNHDNYWIFPHTAPDGDTLGACLAIYLGLKSLRKRVSIFSEVDFPSMYAFLPGREEVLHELPSNSQAPSAIITADFGNLERVGESFYNRIKDIEAEVINLDHHVSNTYFGTLNYVERKAAAAGEIAFDLLEIMGIKLTPEIATNIYVATITDTGRFSFSNTTPKCLRMSARLLEVGANPRDIATKVYNTKTPGQLMLAAHAISEMVFDEEYRFAYAAVTQKMLEETGCVLSDTEGIVETLKTLADADVCFLFKEYDADTVKISMRSKAGFNAASFAESFGGGGHPAASGFTVNAYLEKAVTRVTAAYREALMGMRKNT